MIKPDNFHVHFRQGETLALVARETYKFYARGLVMPNTSPPILNGENVKRYRDEILEITGDKFEPLMTLYMTPNTTPGMIVEAKKAGITAVKIYPKGKTTNSQHGISNFNSDQLMSAIAEIELCGLILSIHAEHPAHSWRVAEQKFIPIVRKWLNATTSLRIVIEHVSSAAMVRFIESDSGSGRVAGTVTPMHLMMTDEDILTCRMGDRIGLNPHNYCFPMPKRMSDRQEIKRVVRSGHKSFFAGDDSAPHHVNMKESVCGCAGAFSAPASFPTYAEFFEGDLTKLEYFMSLFGANFYKLPINKENIKLEKSYKIPNYIYSTDGKITLRPWRAGNVITV